MATSLADQLRKLAIPQTNLLSDSKKRASLLFDPSEAAKLSRDKIFDIGQSGLKELIEINPYFTEFSDSLFNENSKNLQRIVEDKAVNKKLDKALSTFFVRLSPYLLLKPSHKALEWLIYRYRIHESNVSDLLALILPYHETMIFVKILQLINLDESQFSEWAWLQTLQKKGVHLTKQVLINHAISDSSFLRFICETPLKALKVHSKTKSETRLRTVMAFYASSVVGVLTNEGTNDHILTVLLPSLFAGLSSSDLDFKATAYMAVGQLCASNQLSKKLLNQILLAISEDRVVALRQQRLMLLLVIFQRQQSSLSFPAAFFEDFQWAISILSAFARTGTLVGSLIYSIAESLINAILNDSETRVENQILCWALISEVQCDDEYVIKILRMLHKNYKILQSTLDSGDSDSNEDVLNWLKALNELAFHKNAEALNRAMSDGYLQKIRGQYITRDVVEKKLDSALSELVKKCAEGSYSSWPQLKAQLLKRIDLQFVFKAWCRASPPDEAVTLLLCFEQLLSPLHDGPAGILILNNIAASNYGRGNKVIQKLIEIVKDNKDTTIEQAIEIVIQDRSAGFPDAIAWVSAVQQLRTCSKISARSKVWPIALTVMIQLLDSEEKLVCVRQVSMVLDWALTFPPKLQLTVISALIKHIAVIKKEEPKWFDLTKEDVVTMLRLKTLLLCLSGPDETTKVHKRFVECTSLFFKACFTSADAGVRFLSSVCCGLSSVPEVASPVSKLTQIRALHWSWVGLKTNNVHLLKVFKSDGVQLTCHLLLSLSNPSQSVRKAAIKVLQTIVGKFKPHGEREFSFQTLLTQLEARSAEIEADADQLNIALYCLLSPNKTVTDCLESALVPALAEDRVLMLHLLTLPEIPLHVACDLSLLLDTVNSPEIIKDLLPLAKRALNHPDAKIQFKILSSYWQRLNNSTVEVLKNSNVWDLLKSSLATDKDGADCPATALLAVVNKELFAALAAGQQAALMELMVAAKADTENTAVSSAVAVACRKIALDASVIVSILKNMVPQSTTQKTNDARSTVLGARNWRHGLTLLELIQNKKKLRNCKVLIAPLFAVLKLCLDQEEQIAFEYTKQLVLGVLLDICERVLAGEGSVEDIHLDVELIVECLRASSNPQTHHHALLLLSCIGSIIPNHVMHNLMTIFTFMGSSVARLDDEHSVQVVARVVETIVPVLVKSFNQEGYGQDVVLAEVLRIFVWTIKDIPQHRRSPLFSRLLSTLNPECSLWLFLLLIFENYVVSNYKADKNGDGSMAPASVQLGMELCLSFGPEAALLTVAKLVKYLVEVPIHKMNPVPEKEAMEEELPSANGLFDMKKYSAKQLRHYVYTLVTFLKELLSENKLILEVRDLEKSNSELVENIFQDTVGKLLLVTPAWESQHEVQQSKFWKAMPELGNDVLDRLVSLVSSDTLVGVITQLMKNDSPVLRRKALDLLNVHIGHHRGSFAAEEKASLVELVKPLQTIACSRDRAGAGGELIQQSALLSLRFLVKVLGSEENRPLFKELLFEVCKLFKKTGPLMASAALAAADLVAALKTDAFPLIRSFLPPILEVFTSYIAEKSSDILVESIAAALYRVLDVLPQFVSPYMDTLLHSVSILSTKWPDATDLNKKLLQIKQKLASAVPHRVLIPSIARTYEKLVAGGQFSPIGTLLTVLADSFSAAQDTKEISKLLPDLTPLFIKIMQLRSDAVDGLVNVSDEDVDLVEGFVFAALLPFVLKLSETSFKTLYYQLFHWTSEHPHRAITYYRLSSRLAEGLKSLFVEFAGHFLHNAAKLLDAVNVTKSSNPYYGADEAGEARAIMLLENILKTLHGVFLFDSNKFLDKDKFQLLLLPLVDQLDNTLGGHDALNERTKQLLTPCIAQMVKATDDTQWKALNYQVLMKTTSPSPFIRIGALNTIVEIAAKLGEEYSALIPETVGPLAELLEDEDERVETAMKEAVRRMEDVTGQPIRDYLQ